tara:strand:+ start:816 stop:1034 length:219 start_codon:yes stop_codon:yes gene_type:complete
MIEAFCLLDIIAIIVLVPLWLNKKKVEKEGGGKDGPSDEPELFDYAFGLFGLLGILITVYVIWLFFTTPWGG